MTVLTAAYTKTRSPYLIWMVGVSFVLFQFFLQLSSGIVIGEIMQELNWSALRAGFLSSIFYYVYTTFQIPVGLLFDNKDTRTLLTVNALICSLGCFIFASSETFACFVIGRLLMGAGAAFAFVGLSHLLREHFPLRQFAFMIGLSETLGFGATVLGMIGMGALISYYGWHYFIHVATIVGLCISAMCWFFIAPSKPSSHTNSVGIGAVLRDKVLWINGIYAGLTFSVITVFGALWAVPFLQIKLSCGVKEASVLAAMVFLGAGLSCPLFGQLSAYFTKRRPLMWCSCFLTILFLMLVIYYPTESVAFHGWTLFLTGLSCGAYMLAFTISNEISPALFRSTSTGLTNTLAMLSAPILQPLIGWLLDMQSTHQALSLADYQGGLSVVLVCLVIAAALVYFLPEKKSDVDCLSI